MMLKSLFVFLFLFANLMLSLAQPNFKMVFSSSSYDEGIAAFRTSNLEYRIVGTTSAFGNGSKDVLVIALDSNANFLWQKTYGNMNVNQATAAIISPTDELIIVGNSMVNTNNPTINIFAYRIDFYGVMVQEFNMGGVDWDFAHSVSLFNDSAFLIAGKTFNGPLSGEYSPFVVSVGFNNSIQWTSFAGSGKSEVNLDIIANNQAVYLVGSTLDSHQNYDSAFVKALDFNGLLLWENFIPQSRGNLSSLAFYSDTTIITTGFYYDSLTQWREPWIIKFDTLGQILAFAIQPQGGDAYYSDIIADGLNLMTAIGMTTYYGSGGKDIYVGGFDAMGYWQKSNILGGKFDDLPASVYYHSPDSSYLICGTTSSFGNYSSIILNQTKTNFSFDTTTVLVFLTNLNPQPNDAFKISVFPNPTNDNLTFHWDTELKDDVKITVFNVQGQKVLSDLISKFEILKIIDLKAYNPGVYIIQLEYLNQLTTTKIIKN